MERSPWRRLVLQTIAVAGGVVGLYLLVMLVNLPITARVIGQHILYDSPHFYVRATMALYLLGTCVTFDVLQPPMRRGVRDCGLCVGGCGVCCLYHLVHFGLVLLCYRPQRACFVAHTPGTASL
jgi:hypothetical protein